MFRRLVHVLWILIASALLATVLVALVEMAGVNVVSLAE
jgi:hypothetical protein